MPATDTKGRILTSVFLDPDLKKALAHLKERDGINEGESIRRAIRQWLDERGVLRPKRKSKKGG